MEISTEKLKELLVSPGLVSEPDFNIATAEAEAQKINLSDVLVDKDFIKDKQLGQIIAEGFGFKFVDLSQEKIDENILGLIPELVARSKEIIPFAKTSEGIKVGMTNPDDLETRHLIEKRVGQNIIPFFVTKKALYEALYQYKESIIEAFQSKLKQLEDVTLSREERDEMTVEVVDMLIQYGYDNKASDVHIEPYEDKIVMRFRIDGVMHDVLEMPKSLSDFIITRIKILSGMRTDEHRAAQDGKFQFNTKEENIDVRVSVVPITEGENIVMRLLSSKSRSFSLSSLGLLDTDLVKVEKAAKKPHGMILVTGPTGSGKTTTIYAVMKILNKRDVHISTIEDPVEYDIEGISQIQVNEKTNLTFSNGLRAIVRQDPDIIMVGEIRDEETANIAVNSAMTGHLVLSTLHANNTATTIPRLIDMKVEPFLVASTINVIIAQRLVRKLCEKCRTSYSLSKDEIENIKSEPNFLAAVEKFAGKKKLDKLIFYKGSGCKSCGDTGYSGRIGVFEVMEISDELRPLITSKSTSNDIENKARELGMTPMLEDGVNKAFQGITTLTEVLRVTKI